MIIIAIITCQIIPHAISKLMILLYVIEYNVAVFITNQVRLTKKLTCLLDYSVLNELFQAVWAILEFNVH